MEKEDLFNSTGKKFINRHMRNGSGVVSSGKDSASLNEFNDSGAKTSQTRRSRVRKLVESFSRIEEMSALLEELRDSSIHGLDPNLLSELTTKLNIGKEIAEEISDVLLSVCTRNGAASLLEFKRVTEMQLLLDQYKLLMPAERTQMQFILSLKELFEKLLRNLKIPFDKLSFDKIAYNMFENVIGNDSLGERIDLDQLNGFYVDLLSITELTSKQPQQEPVRSTMARLAKKLEDKFTEAIWASKALELKQSDTLLVG